MTVPTHAPRQPPDWEGIKIQLEFYTDADNPTPVPAHVSFDHMQPGFDFRIGQNITFSVTLTDLARVMVKDAPEYQK